MRWADQVCLISTMGRLVEHSEAITLSCQNSRSPVSDVAVILSEALHAITLALSELGGSTQNPHISLP